MWPRTTDTAKIFAILVDIFETVQKNAAGQAAAGSRWKPWSIRHFSMFTSPCQLPQTWLTKIHWSFFAAKFAGLRGAWLPLLLAARLTNGFIVATVRAGDTGWSDGRQPPPYVLSSHQVIPRFKLQSSEPFRDTGDVIMTLLGGRKCQNNVSPRFGNEYGWMFLVTGLYLQHNSSNIKEGMNG